MGHLLKIGVLVSGNGTNLQAILDRCADGSLSAEIACVISNKAEAYALERARKHGIPTVHIDHRDYPGRAHYDAALVDTLHKHDVGLVVLAGFMRIITPVLIDAFPAAIMNIHPALLPAFPGLHAQRQALEYGVRITGCTVHFVDAGTDTGPIILQTAVAVDAEDTEETLSAKIQLEEHRIYPQAIQLYADGRLKVVGRKVIISPLPRTFSPTAI
jgi:phosphoribosylglycinamide formyltransferase 1